MRTYLAPDLDLNARARERQQRLRDRLRDTLRGDAENRLIEPIEDNLKDMAEQKEHV